MDTTTTETAPAPIIEQAPPVVETTPTEAQPAPEAVSVPDKKPDAAPGIDELLSSVQLSEMTSSQLADIESGDPTRIRAALGVAEPFAAGQPKAADTPPVADEDKEFRRISLKAIKDPNGRAGIARAINLVRDGKHESIEGALAEVFKLPASQPAPQQEDPAPTPPVDEAVKTIEDQIAKLEEERQEAKASYEYDTAEEKLAAIMELKLDLRDAKRAAETKATQSKVSDEAQAKWTADESASRDRALDKYGEMMTDPDSTFADYLEVELSLAERRKDAIFNQPDWPEQIADRVHEKYFKGNRGADSAREPAPQIPPAPPQGIRLPGSPVGNGANSVALTAPAAAVEFDKLTEEQRFAALTLAEERMAKTRR